MKQRSKKRKKRKKKQRKSVFLSVVQSIRKVSTIWKKVPDFMKELRQPEDLQKRQIRAGITRQQFWRMEVKYRFILWKKQRHSDRKASGKSKRRFPERKKPIPTAGKIKL